MNLLSLYKIIFLNEIVLASHLTHFLFGYHCLPDQLFNDIFICNRRPRIDRSMIGEPMDFRHTGHVGSTDLGLVYLSYTWNYDYY